MATQPQCRERVVFGDYELDCLTGELQRNGKTVRLQPQPAKVLSILVSRAGEIVTREELAEKVWGSDIHVDFEHGLNFAIRKIRSVLEDHSENPRYLETVPKRGYRFIAAVADSAQPRRIQPTTSPRVPPYKRRRLFLIISIALAAAVIVSIALTAAVIGIVSAIHWWPRNTAASHKIGSLAVLPLANLSGNSEQEYFADGLTDALITDLAQIHALRVISRNSIMLYKGNPKPTPQIARELNVDAVVSGAVQQSGGRVRISAQLIQGATDRHLWAKTYESDMKDVLVLENEVARAISNEIKVEVLPQEQVRLDSAPTINPQAHDAYLKGRFFYYKETAEDLPKAIQYAQRAIEIDPNYALAYAMLAACYYDSSESRWGHTPDTEAAEKATITALKALQFDNSLAEAHVVLGAVHDGHDWDWAGAEREFRQAIDLDPNLVQAHIGYAWHLAFVGRSDEALRQVSRAVELDPVSRYTLSHQNFILYLTRHYDQAIEQVQRWLELFPNSPGAYYRLAREFEARGEFDQEVAALQKAMTLEGRPANEIAEMEQAYKLRRIRGLWRWDLESSKSEGARGKVNQYKFAELYSLLGEKDKAFEWLEKMYASRGQGMFIIKMDPRCDNLRSDPRYRDILHRMNVAP